VPRSKLPLFKPSPALRKGIVAEEKCLAKSADSFGSLRAFTHNR
jgi:hypothetical protein